MKNIKRPAPFALLSTNHGSMIINTNDYRMVNEKQGFGVGYQLMQNSCFDSEEVDFVLNFLQIRRKEYGDGVVAIDCGANIGVHTIEWGRLMSGWGEVISFEAQEKVYYALAGNIAINNCLNVTAKHAAVGESTGTISIPEPNYLVPSSFGSFELRARENTEYIGQDIDYSAKSKDVALVALDSLGLDRLDFIKIDVEGMELDVLEGAKTSINDHKPIMLIETIKSDKTLITKFLKSRGYQLVDVGINVLAIHKDDKAKKHVEIRG